jgi:hypothetical protein
MNGKGRSVGTTVTVAMDSSDSSPCKAEIIGKT